MKTTEAPAGAQDTESAMRILAFLAIYLLWGGTFLALRYAVAEMPPMLTIAIRCAGGAVILSLWSLTRGTFVRPTLAQWRTAAAAGGLFFLGCHTALAWSEQRVPSGHAALLLASIPLWLVVLDSFLHRRRPSMRVVSGLAVGVLGVFVLAEGPASWAGSRFDQAVILVSGLFWATGSLVSKYGSRPPSAAQSTSMQLAVGALAVAIGSLVVGEPASLHSAPSSRAVLALAFLILCGTTLAFAAYSWLLRVTSPAAVGTYAFVNPVVAVGLAWAVGDEPFTLHTVLAATLVVSAVLLVRERKTGEVT